MKKNLLIISDGNGVDTDFKKWPTLLKLLTTKEYNVINKSIIGASNDMILMQIADAVKDTIDCAIIQWTIPKRIDVLATEFWREQAKIDPVYYFNIVNANDHNWWVTSASKNQFIKDYHNLYVLHDHAVIRSQIVMLSAAEILKYNRVKFVFSLCYAFDFTDPYQEILNSYTWAWHEANKGINEFRFTSKFLPYDQGKAQPHTLIGLDWIDQVLRPDCEFIDYDAKTYYNVQQSLLKNV